MTSLDTGQLNIARILFSLPAAGGFALAGGSALVVHGAIDRPTRDIDAFVAAQPRTPPGDVTPLANQRQNALEAEAWTVAVIRHHQTFTRLVASKGQDSVEVDLAVDSPPLFPIEVVDGLPLLAAEDLAARKILAIIDRAEGRDFTDLDALQQRYGQDNCINWAQQLDSGLTTAAIADAFTKITRLADAELPTEDPSATRACFSDWISNLRAS